ncbi:hypothetical protein PMIN06_008669 [Paraphaeosphaeria minitans]
MLQYVGYTQTFKCKRSRENDSDSEGEDLPKMAKTPRSKRDKKKLRVYNSYTTPKSSPPATTIATPAPGPRLTANGHEYDPTQNVFKQSQQNHPRLPPTPPETPVAQSSSEDKSSESPASSNAQWRRLGMYELPLHDPKKTSVAQYTWTCSREAVEIHTDAHAFLLLAEEAVCMRKELAEARQQEVGPEKEELEKKLELSEEALAVERKAKKVLENELAAERQAKKILQDELATEREGKANLENELSLEQKSTKTLQEKLATSLQEKEDLRKARNKDASNHSTKLERLEKENKNLSEKFRVEKKKCQGLENSKAMFSQQYQQFEKEKVLIQEQIIEHCKNHVLKVLIRILAEYWNDGSLTVDTIAPELHAAFFDMIDGNTTFDQLADQVSRYYDQNTGERAKFEGSVGQGAATVGTQNYASSVPQPQACNWQQPAPLNASASQANVLVNQPEVMEFEASQVVTNTPLAPTQPQVPIISTKWTPSSAAQRPSTTDVGYAVPEAMEVEAIKPRCELPCTYFDSDRGCNKGKKCTFLHAHTVNGLGDTTTVPMEIEAPKYKKKMPCRFFRGPGGCKQGAACTYLHPADSSALQQVNGTGIVASMAEPMDLDTSKRNPECRFAHRPGGCTRQNCPFTHPADPSAAQRSSATGQRADTTEIMEVEVPGQRPICKFMLRPGGCRKRDTCTSTHPGDPGCGIAPEAVAILDREVLPAQRVLLQAKSEDAKLQPVAQMARGYYKFINQIIGSARQASLNRKNKIIFMKMMDGHIGTAGVLIQNAPPSLVRRFNLPTNGFLAAGSSIDGWFDAGSNMPEDCKDSWMLLKMFDKAIADKIQLPVQVAPSIVLTPAPPAWNNQQGSYAGHSVTSLGAPAPIQQLEQDLDAIIRSGGQHATSQAKETQSRSSRSAQPFGNHGGSQP